MRTVPPGQATGPTAPLWWRSRTGNRWTFHDPSGTLAGGIKSVVISTQPNLAPGRYAFSVRGTGVFQLPPQAVPATIMLSMNFEKAMGRLRETGLPQFWQNRAWGTSRLWHWSQRPAETCTPQWWQKLAPAANATASVWETCSAEMPRTDRRTRCICLRR